MSKLLNVYIVTNNRSQMLKKMIDSVLKQSFFDFDLYILDNASTDDTEIVVSEFKDKRINYIRHKKNIGGVGNINYALESCNSKYIIILHDDDIVCKDLIKKELTILELYSDIKALSCNDLIINEVDEVIGDYKYKESKEEFYCIDDYFGNYINTGRTLVFPATMYDNVFLKKYNLKLDTKVGPCADVVLHMDIERFGGKLAIINEQLIKYRMHNMQDSSINNIPMTISLYNYIMNHDYYSKKIILYKNGQKRIYKNNIRNVVVSFIKKKNNYEKTLEYIDSFSKTLTHSIFDEFIYRFVVHLFNKQPMIMYKLLSFYKKMKEILK